MEFTLSDLQRALDRDEIAPSFQPLVGLHTGRLTGFEVLARWQDPEHGLRLPANCIALAEQNGLMGPLMRQVFRKAFSASVLLEAPLLLSVNVSPTQLREPGLAREIFDLAEESGISPGRLMVEITESAMLRDNLPTAQKIAHELKECGCKLALDDFGTGYSSLSHLQTLPVDELKVDRRFVESMTTSRESRKIVASIVGLGHSMGLITVAEGIESEEQADMLLWLGCEQGQGWLYGRPVPAAQMGGFISAPPRVVAHRSTSPGEGWATSNLEAMPTHRLAQLQAIYDGAPVGLCFIDRTFRYISLNEKLAEMNGLPVQAHVGKLVREIHPSLYAKLEPFLLRALDGECAADIEIEIPTKNAFARVRTDLISFYPALDEEDEVVGISIAVLDITENKNARTALRAGATQGDDPQGHGNHTQWMMDPDGNSLEPSSEWVLTAKLGKDRTRTLHWLEAVHADDLAPTMKTIQESLRAGAPLEIEYRVKDLDGEWKWMRVKGSPKLDAGGEILRWYGTVEYSERNVAVAPCG
jgi:PAS domain S-box-containing protein